MGTTAARAAKKRGASEKTDLTMKKFIIFLIAILIFSGCLWVGYQVTGDIIPVKGEAGTQKPASLKATQQNLFLIHVDQLQAAQPKLISAWILFLYYGDTPSMTFKLIYQQDGSVRHPADLQQLFKVNPDGSLQADFIKALRSNVKLPVDGYVVMDDMAIEKVSSRTAADSAPSPEPYQIIIPGEKQAIQQLCDHLQNLQVRKQGFDLPWNELGPDRFRTDLNFTAFMNNWYRLSRASKPPHCEIISP
jgi:hypothetical protein